MRHLYLAQERDRIAQAQRDAAEKAEIKKDAFLSFLEDEEGIDVGEEEDFDISYDQEPELNFDR